jgi:hypothetical protein
MYKKRIKTWLALLVFFSGYLQAQTTILSADFSICEENYSEFGAHSDGTNDYFMRTTGSADDTNCVSVASGTSGDLVFTNLDGHYYTGEDINSSDNTNTGDFGSASQTSGVHFNDIDVSSFANVEIVCSFAASTGSQFDVTDYINIYVDKTNNGTYELLASFRTVGGLGNSSLSEDTDLNGTGDGTVLTQAFQAFTFSVTGATTMDVRIELNVDGGNEEVAFDTFIVQSNNASPSLSAAIAAQNNVVCSNDSTGTITVNAIGGVGPYSYLWSNGDTSLSSASASNTITDLPTGTYFVTIVDANSDSAATTAAITAVDTISPTVITQNISVFLNATGNASITPQDVDNGSSDACGLASLSLDTSTFDASNIGGNTVVLTVTDVNGNSASAQATVSVLDTFVASPFILSEGFENCQGNYSEYGAYTDGSSDYFIRTNGTLEDTNCISSVTSGDLVFTNTSGFYYTAEDNERATENPNVNGDFGSAPLTSGVHFNNIDVSSFNSVDVGCSFAATSVSSFENGDYVRIYVDKTNNGTYELLAAFETQNGLGNDSLSWDTNLDGQGDSTVLTEAFQAFTFKVFGATVMDVRIEVLSSAGNEEIAFDSFTVEGSDDIAPPLSLTVTAQNNVICSGDSSGSITVELAGGVSPYSYSWSTGDSILNTSARSNTLTSLAVGNYSVTVVDANSDSVSVSASIIQLDDTIAPVVSTQNITVTLDSSGTASITAQDIDDGSSDLCGITSLSIDVSTFTTADVGANPVTLTATDNSGNSASAQATVTVQASAPVSSIILNEGFETCQGNYSEFGSFSDGSNDYFIRTNGIAQDTNCAAAFTSGSIVFTNTNGFYYTGEDVDRSAENPNTTGEFGSAPLTSGVHFNDIDVSSSTGVEIECSFATSSANSFENGDYIRIYVDKTNNGVYELLAAFETVGGAGNTPLSQDTDLDGIGDGTVLSQTFQAFTFPVTAATIMDIRIEILSTSGNEEMAFDTFIIKGNSVSTPLVTSISEQSNVVCSSDSTGSITVDVSGGISPYSYLWSTGDSILNTSARSNTLTSLAVGNYSVTVVDANSDSITLSTSISALDTVAPIASTQNLTVFLDANGNASISAQDLDNNSTDNCEISSLSISTSTFDCSDISGDNSIQIVSDGSWTESTVIDSTSVFSFPWSGAPALPATATFNQPVDVGQPYPWVSIQPIPGSQVIRSFNYIRFYRKTFTLSSLNNLSARARMSVDDDMEIYINGKLLAREGSYAQSNFKGAPHDLHIDSSGTTNGFNGGDAFDFVSTLSLDSLFNIGNNEIILAVRNGIGNNRGGFTFALDLNTDFEGNPVVLTVEDASGNTSQATGLVTVVDTIAPSITNLSNSLLVNAASGDTAARAFWFLPNASDACGIQSFNGTHHPGDHFPIGTTTVTYTALDVNGNSTSASFNVTVVEPTPAARVETIATTQNGDVKSIDESLNGDQDEAALQAKVFELYPNPLANGQALTLSVSSTNEEPTEISVYNSTGQLVYAQKTKLQKGVNTIELSLQNLRTGTYFVRTHAQSKAYPFIVK